MSRWQPDAQGRLLRAALDLFAEHGYDATTTAQIAERAGLTKTTLFRLFSDKRDIVFQGQGELVALIGRGVADAPDDSTAVELMRHGVRTLSGAHTEEHRSVGRILDPILLSSPELKERAVYKRAAITSALHDALTERRVDHRQAGILADLGVRAYYAGYETWVAADDVAPLADHVLAHVALLEQALSAVARSAELGRTSPWPRQHHDGPDLQWRSGPSGRVVSVD
ncbi:TetR/AcrR family transcriptional regulator [Agreia sp. COWG]|uniref:TetR/AcrR family transcriptional regulator n=1 Tax=Agreia sp. COWG TaxID=2773266 RepID=UPI001928872F|nr:TetR/AcrR family transcriptional regulator [Agreia sp. COWG]CAD6010561.1 HTH tetR-type domain-containing protein [Agreia sp. COWG]